MQRPRIGLLFLGRKRPGFDPEWGAEIRRRIRALLADWDAVIPEDSIPDDAGLRAAMERCRREGVGALVVTQPTISDGRLSAVLAQAWQEPFVLWATPEKPTGAMISSNSLVGTHVFASNLRHLGRPFELVYGHPDQADTARQLDRAVRLAAAATRLRRARVGLFGYHAPGFTDFHADPVALDRLIGAQLYHESVPELVARVEAVPQAAVEADRAPTAALGLPLGEVTDDDLAVQSRYYLAIKKAMAEEGLDAVALRCWPELPALIGHWPYLALSRLMDEGAAVTMEGDVDGALCSLAAESLGLGPVHYTDWLEHDVRTVTTWHTGAVPLGLCQEPGRPGAPALGLQFNNRRPTVVEAVLKPGVPVTLFRLWRCDGACHMTAVEGRTAEPRRPLMAVNGLVELPEVDVPAWFDEMVHAGMPHHVSLVRGHHADWFRRLSRLAGWRWL